MNAGSDESPGAGEPLICACPHCAGLIQFPPELAGAGVDCPHCGTPVNLLEPGSVHDSPEEIADSAADLPAGRLDASILATALAGRVPHSAPTLSYRLALLFVTLAMLVLPAAYLGVVGAVVGLIGWFAIGWFPWARHFTGGTTLMGPMVLIYVIGISVGGFVLLSLVKPLFARRRTETALLALNPAAEPLLFAFVHLIADAVGAPRPARIDVDCRLNASAGFRRGFVSLVGRDFVLGLGLPLVATCDLRQLAGVVAHELAHFKQGWGLRASYVVRGINAWLARVAYERDSWDDALADYAEHSRSAFGLSVVGAARLGVWLSRGLLIVLVQAGHAVSRLFLRQLERDADRCQIVVSGTAAFETTLRRIHVLNDVAREFYRQLRAAAESGGRLPDNVPAAIVAADIAVPQERRQRLIERALARTPEWSDSHPPDVERLACAGEMAAPGLFQLDGPATGLFADFTTLARQATILHYEDDLGLSRDRVLGL